MNALFSVIADRSSQRARRRWQKILDERDEILRHKWFLSNQAGQDVGFEKALLDWILQHRSGWNRAWNHAHPWRP